MEVSRRKAGLKKWAESLSHFLKSDRSADASRSDPRSDVLLWTKQCLKANQAAKALQWKVPPTFLEHNPIYTI